MALLSTQIPNASADVVGVFDSNLSQLFTQARAIKATISEGSKTMEHPVETGVTITDHRVVLPVMIELSTIIQALDYRSVYQQIRQVFYDGRLLTVQTKTSSYRNMIIEEMPHVEDGDMFDTVAIAIKLREVLFVSAQYSTLPANKVRNKSQATTTARGQVQPKDATVTQETKASRQSVIYGVVN